MSEENVELLKRGYAALQANDIDAFLVLVDPDVEWQSLILEIEGVFHGHDGVREWTFRNGRVTSMIGHDEPKDALKAAGL